MLLEFSCVFSRCLWASSRSGKRETDIKKKQRSHPSANLKFVSSPLIYHSVRMALTRANILSKSIQEHATQHFLRANERPTLNCTPANIGTPRTDHSLHLASGTVLRSLAFGRKIAQLHGIYKCGRRTERQRLPDRDSRAKQVFAAGWRNKKESETA
ncbi:hypothetical protein M5D96_006854 [Drosophila gunungcola]|uniref:Uncharacterized protein n=1 Tax=Drosophila gunungcola TaxID=103775 RepID=A0A9Q0BQX1_9MUSC|nr:hypothetical protein M5D96_006854 [Drosophila gunungcola]